MPDRGKRKFCFHVTCGHTGTPFEIAAENQRSKQEWMLAIKKAIALAKVLDGSSNQEDFSDYLAGFYLLKYGTPQPLLARQDSTVRNMKFQATMHDQRKRLSGLVIQPGAHEDKGLEDSLSDDLSQDLYLPMGPGESISSNESSDEENYTTMQPISEQLVNSYDSTISFNSSNVTQSLPCYSQMSPSETHKSAGSFSVTSWPTKVEKVPVLQPTPERDEEQFDVSGCYDSVVLDDSGRILNRGYSNAALLDRVENDLEFSYIKVVNERTPPPCSNTQSTSRSDLSYSSTSKTLDQGAEAKTSTPNLYLTLLPDKRDYTRTLTEPVLNSYVSNGGPPVPARKTSASPVTSPTRSKANSVYIAVADVQGYPSLPPKRRSYHDQDTDSSPTSRSHSLSRQSSGNDHLLSPTRVASPPHKLASKSSDNLLTLSEGPPQNYKSTNGCRVSDPRQSPIHTVRSTSLVPPLPPK